ncbi:MAG TPA: hypothetical protein VGO68_05235 [Pyrinomonadaceae bacterium]|jgi:hypothetical protein|nr:hypothetical protein [Pyrinomonadaceae bacterium]
MSRFTPEMDRDGIQWQEPVGTWKQADNIARLNTIAEKLVIPPELKDTDMLNSIPTPWSRLLLFENALYNQRHPSHAEVLDQWRGLLGLLALANPLGIRIQPSIEPNMIDLPDFAHLHPIAKSFVDLQPHYAIQKNDVEAGKWNQFHLIQVGNQLLGATSPRTLVFTAIDHQCPPTIPFRTVQGRLSDPLAYFARFGDRKYLVLLKQWIDSFVAAVQTNQALINWLGTFPDAPDVVPERRHERLIGLLEEWQSQIIRAVPRGAAAIPSGQPVPVFTLKPYDALTFLPEVPVSGESDLLLGTVISAQKKVVICFRPDRSQDPAKTSTLHNDRGQMIQSDPLLICDGRWTYADEPLPEALDFLPPGWLYISDPISELFEDHVIEVELPEAAEDAGSAYTLTAGQKNFLYPFKKTILDYFTPAELSQFATIEVEADRGYRVTLQLPLVNGRSVRATRRYENSANELILVNNKAVDHLSSELAVWPNFAAKDWNYYFYFKRRIAPSDKPTRNLDFTPVDQVVPRSNPDGSLAWYFARQPVAAFIGSVSGRQGLLLPKYQEIPPAGDKDHWNVSVDFGSTHTRVFYVLRHKDEDGGFSKSQDARIERLEFSAYAKQITTCNPEVFANHFFALSGKLDPPTRVELKTLLMQPVSDSARHIDWRPREGFAFMHWLKGNFDDRRLKTDIKWESNGGKGELNSYLRCLMVMVQAEAVKRNAEIVFVTRSYPTAFNSRLRADHNLEWVALGSFMKLPVEADTKKVLSEAVATARFLGRESAPPISNTVSLDIGGSTTDIAVWYSKRVRTERGERPKATLGIQESVRMAAGSVGRYLQSDPNAREFLQWFLQAVKKQGVFQEVTLDSFANRRLGFALMFYDILTYYELAGDRLKNEYDALVGLIKTRDEARGLVIHLIYLFGSLAYYAGLLARKVGLREKSLPVYHLYFCGKGGTLITWIENYQKFAEKLFLAGLFGPLATDNEVMSPESGTAVPATSNPDDERAPASSTLDRSKSRVHVHISPRPKEEVGRGLLEEFTTREDAEDDEDVSFGLVDTEEHAVTVAETGYKIRSGNSKQDLKWSDDLNREVLGNLDENLPAFDAMKELNCFVGAVREAFKHQTGRDGSFDLNKILNNKDAQYDYLDRLTSRLLGDHEGSVLHDLEQEDNPNALVEPLLITEMKVLLELLSNNEKLFR